MAGKALRRRILADVLSKGGAEYLFEQIASGNTLTALAKEYDCSRQYLSTSLKTIPEYGQALSKARQEAADALVEQGLTMVDDLDGGSTSSEIAATREKVQWRYGNRPQTNVNISLGDMHLDALRKVNSDLAAIHKEDQEREAKTIDADYEDVSDE